ncbi:MAG: T9SS type A sorting domain-containing protein [Bacteroidetes bacterium]|nr:T9SS type A sorting domain-containing protein [Bacteroidota bacterium]
MKIITSECKKNPVIRLMLLSLMVSFMMPALLAQSALPQFQVNGSAFADGANCYTLTTDNYWLGGSVWAKDRINLLQPFEFQGSLYFGCNDYGADGIVFVLQGAGNTALGGYGEGLGYGAYFGNPGINPSLAVEFDTWYNSNHSDPTYDHIAVITSSSVSHNVPSNLLDPVPMFQNKLNGEDCIPHDLQIKWNPKVNKLRVYLDGDLRLTYTGDMINTIFGGERFVYWGFTGSTGASKNLQQVCIDDVAYTEEGDNTFTLINALTDLDIGPLQSGDVIDLATLSTNKLAIRANMDMPGVESVRFGFQGIAKYKVENFPPYALHGDKNGDYNYFTYYPGAYTVSATPYDHNNAKGIKGETKTVHFMFVDSSPGAKLASASLIMDLYPNPAQDKFNIDLNNVRAGELQILMYNANGVLVSRHTEDVNAGIFSHTMNIQDLPAGLYIVKVRNGENDTTGKIVKF